MSRHAQFLSHEQAQRLREIDAAIQKLKEQRIALIQPSRQMISERNRLIADRLDAGEPVASLCAEFQLTRARIYEIAAKARSKAQRASRTVVRSPSCSFECGSLHLAAKM
jgi:Mor family transcriptional regulator